MLTCQNLCLKKDGKTVFSNLGISLQPGACLVVKGKNGSGKTSFLKTCATLFIPYTGSIHYNDVNIKNAIDEYRYLINYVGHEDTLNEELTVIENLDLWSQIYDTTINLPAAIKPFAIEEYLNIKVKKISKGMKRKILLTKLLLNHASIWLLDEPFINLDVMGVENLLTLISVRCSQGGIVIVSTNHEIRLNTPLILNMEDYKDE